MSVWQVILFLLTALFVIPATLAVAGALFAFWAHRQARREMRQLQPTHKENK